MKCVVNFALGQQSQTELRLYFGVCILQQFQQSGHRNGRFACGGHSLRAGAFLFGVETFLKLLAQFYTRGLLDMRIGVHQHICRSVSSGSLNGLHIAAGDHQLISRTGMPLRYNYDKPEKPRISRVFGYLARFFILFQTEKSSREVVIS